MMPEWLDWPTVIGVWFFTLLLGLAIGVKIGDWLNATPDLTEWAIKQNEIFLKSLGQQSEEISWPSAGEKEDEVRPTDSG